MRNLLLNSSHLVDLLLGVVEGIVTIFFYYEMFYLICFFADFWFVFEGLGANSLYGDGGFGDDRRSEATGSHIRLHRSVVYRQNSFPNFYSRIVHMRMHTLTTHCPLTQGLFV